MTVTFKLERLDGTPAEPPSFKTSVLSTRVGGACAPPLPLAAPVSAHHACAWALARERVAVGRAARV
jgi:hypothetical protein